MTGSAVKKGTLRKGSHLVWNSITYTAVLTVTEVSAVLVFPERNSAWTVRVVRRSVVKPVDNGRLIFCTRRILSICSAFSSQALTPLQSIPKRRVASGQPAMLRVCLRNTHPHLSRFRVRGGNLMIRFALASPRRTRILAVGTLIASLAVSAWAWQLPGGFETEGPLPAPGPPEGEAAAPVAQLPQPIFTNRPTFRIPFQFNQEEISRLGAQEIRLYASGDRGAQWHHVQTVQPAAQKFNFKATGDGEYWFTVQTVDSNNQLHPGGPVMQPGLIVVVDSTRPTLQLTLRQSEPGEVQLSWNVIDEAVNADSLSLEYSQTGSTQWQQVAVLPADQGQTSWSVPLGGLVAVRGRVRDRAGNEGTAESTVQINPAGNAPATGPDLNGPVATNPGELTLPPAISQRDPGLLVRPGQNPIQPSPLALPGPQLGPDPYAINPSPLPPLSSRTPDLSPIPRPALNRDPLATNPAPLSTSPGMLPPQGTQPRGLQPTQPEPWQQARTDQGSIPPAPGVVDFPGTSPRQDSLVSSRPGMARQEFPTYTEQNSNPGHRTVNSRKFHIDYRIDDIGPSGVSSVELFVTQNNGEKWYRYGIDEDRRSPFEVEVPGDGMFGFSMRVVSGAGLTDPPPQAGQRPDIVIVADSSPPVVNLMPLQQGTGRNANKIRITWNIQDRKLAERPVSLSYSANPNGPWEPMGGVRNAWQPLSPETP